MSRAILWDDLGVGVKGLTSSGIAGSPRNSFRTSLGIFLVGVEHWKGYRGFCQVFLPNSEYYEINIPGVRGWGISSILERGTTQTPG